MYVATDGARTHNLFAKNSASLPLADDQTQNLASRKCRSRVPLHYQ